MRLLFFRPMAFFFSLALLIGPAAHGAAPLNALDALVVSHGYAGAQFIQLENSYRLPISINGKAGDLTIDTGAPTSVIFKATLKKFGLNAKETENVVHGVFGKGTEKIGLTTIPRLTMGNCTLVDVRAAVISDPAGSGLYRQYGISDGLLGLTEMLQFGAVLDISSHLLLVHPGGQTKGISAAIRSLLTKSGYTPVEFRIGGGHLHVKARINGTPANLVVDTGAFVSVLDDSFARQARLGGDATESYASGFGTKARPVRLSHFPELQVGDFVIHNASITVTQLDPELLRGGSGQPSAVGLLGAEYLGMNGAIFDFTSGTLYLRAKKHS